MKRKYYSGAVSGALIAIIALSVGVAVTSGLAVWAYLEYTKASTDVNGQIALAVAGAERDKKAELEAQFQERENALTREFVGPDDYGRLSFMYSKIWSVYVAKDGSNSAGYEAYLHPVTVPTVARDERFALRVSIVNKEYDSVLATYQKLVSNGDLKSSVVTANGHTGTRFDGSFDDNIRGAAVVFKIRDKTVVLRTDADTFKPLFEKLVATIDFNT